MLRFICQPRPLFITAVSALTILMAVGCKPRVKARPAETGAETFPSGNNTVAVIDSASLYKTPPVANGGAANGSITGPWKIDSMWRKEGTTGEALQDVEMTINEDRFVGRAPCNSIFGKLSIKGANIAFSEIGATRMACPNLGQEAAFLKLLQREVKSFSLDSNRLLLVDGTGRTVLSGIRK